LRRAGYEVTDLAAAPEDATAAGAEASEARHVDGRRSKGS
jgi:hypothetical protein